MHGILLTLLPLLGASPAGDVRQCDLLIVGGGEAGVAAAVQAARLGIPRIVLVNDCHWLGGQFTAEGLCAIDEWTKFDGNRVPFPRSGLFLEVMDLIEADMERKYGRKQPGNCFCAWTTCEPRDTERIFRKLVEPYLAENGGALAILENLEPVEVLREGNKVNGVRFVPAPTLPGIAPSQPVTIKAPITIDASDWGDVVRLSGARYFCGPDLKSRFNEPSAPETFDEVERNEINPITYCLVLRESDEPTIIPKPKHYDERRYYAATTATRDEFNKLGWPKEAMKPFAPAWRDTDLPNGPYTDGPTVYHHRRLVDRRHFNLKPGSELVLVNWPLQDYPTNRYPQHVVDALEATEAGASQKNLVEMTPAQRRIVFADAKLHALGLLYHLQTTVAERDIAAAGGKPIVTFRNLKLTDEFGTPDGLPLKPYVREGLRTEALYMLREQDVRDTDGNQCWAKSMVPDGVFGFQFNIDFHPTKRIFLNNDPRGPWTLVHTKHRNWSTDTDRAMVPLRSLIPRETDGLIVAGKNLGVSSIVQSALRLHGHGMLSGQAAATIAQVSQNRNVKPRQIAEHELKMRNIQELLATPRFEEGRRIPEVLIWPYHDLTSQTRVVAVSSLWCSYVPEQRIPLFKTDEAICRSDLAIAACRQGILKGDVKLHNPKKGEVPTFPDVSIAHPGYRYIEALYRNKIEPLSRSFEPDAIVDNSILKRQDWAAGLLESIKVDEPAARARFAFFLLMRDQHRLENCDSQVTFISLKPGHDSDGDGVPDLDDPLPQDRDNDNIPDRIDAEIK